jgi:flavin reductase (DIM6/NTAB) family NADH-FMN oxidoreductase RutF
MYYDMQVLSAPQRYKLLVSAVTPRPIAWVTSQTADGRRNAAPFSFFNVMGADPPVVVLGIMRRPDGSYKDTARNIIDTGEFVVNLVSESDAERMNLTCIDAPPEIDELALADIETTPSLRVAPPRISSAPVSFECRLLQSLEPGPSGSIIIGEVLTIHVQDRFILDAERLHLDTPSMQLVARMHGAGLYSRSTDLFEMTRPRYEPPS